MRLVAFGIAAGAGFQAWRNTPPDGPVSSDSMWLVLVIAVLCAFVGGWLMGKPWRGVHASATAVAQAKAAAQAGAQSTVNLAVVIPGQGAGDQPLAVRVPHESMPWMGEQRHELTVDDLDGMDLSEFSEQRAEQES